MKNFLLLFIFLSFIPPRAFTQDAGKGAELFKQCMTCHGQKGEGIPAQKAPHIAGQYEWYIIKQLQDIKAGIIRKNPVMLPYLNKLNEQDMKDLAAYISKLQ